MLSSERNLKISYIFIYLRDLPWLMILAYAELIVLLRSAAVCRHTGEATLCPPTPFINMYVFWMVCMALCSHWLMLSVNCLQIRQCCGSSPRTLETRLETAQLPPPPSLPFLPPSLPAPLLVSVQMDLTTLSVNPPPLSFCAAPPYFFLSFLFLSGY